MTKRQVNLVDIKAVVAEARSSRDAVRMALRVLEAEMTDALGAEKGERWRAARNRSGHTAGR